MRDLRYVLLAVIALGLIGVTLVLALYFWRLQAVPAPAARTATMAFSPPNPEDAPADIRDAVMMGYNIMLDTAKYAPAYTGNGLSCSNCHFNGGIAQDGIPLVGVAAVYPKYRERARYATDLVARTDECFERSMNGKAAPVESREMQALQAYYAWISRGIPIYSKVPWLGVKRIKTDHVPNAEAGATVFRARCTPCHGTDGQGTNVAPPLWGPKSFNDGAGMNKVEMLASFAFANMPRGAPGLSVAQAFDVAAFIAHQSRPHFATKH
ncbi:MAG: c-type cytochrome [Terriglobales bacterium]